MGSTTTAPSGSRPVAESAKSHRVTLTGSICCCLTAPCTGTQGDEPVIRVVQLALNHSTEIGKLLGASRMSILKLWSSDCIVYVVGHRLQHITIFVRRGSGLRSEAPEGRCWRWTPELFRSSPGK